MNQPSQPSNSPREPSPSVPPVSSVLPEEATLLRLLVEAARDFGIFALEPDGTILTWNPGVQNITGYEEAEFVGMNCDRLFTPEDREMRAPEQERETALREGQALDERWHMKKDGTRFWGSGFMHALYDDSGRFTCFAKILRDMTKEKRHEEEMEARVQERTAAHLEVQRRLNTAEEDERRRISRELHDHSGQYLAALGIELGAMEQAAGVIREAALKALHVAGEAARRANEAAQVAETTATAAAKQGSSEEAARLARAASEAARTAAIAGTDAQAAAAAGNAALGAVDEAAPRLQRLRELTTELSRELHRLAVDLRPTSLDDLGLVAALRTLAEEWQERTSVLVDLETVGLDDSPEKQLPPEVVTALYRITQEAFTNAAKYAVPGGATRMSVTLQRRDSIVLATIEDDGPG
ncbi:MAG: PAS domain S-box protein, partial [Verrucomicrobiota bacterium]